MRVETLIYAQHKEANDIFCIFAENKNKMVELARNILAFTGTFIIVATTVMFAVQTTVMLFTGRWKMSVRNERISVCIGLLAAIALIPFYYFPY